MQFKHSGGGGETQKTRSFRVIRTSCPLRLYFSSAVSPPMRFRFFFVGLLSVGLTASRPAHDFHASVTQMQYNPKEKTFEISIRIFTDDLERALSQASNAPIHSDKDSKNDALLERYIRSHFVYMTPQKQAKRLIYVGHEVEADANWLYLEMPYTESIRNGVLKQSVLMEMFDDQVNMVNIQYLGQKKTVVFRKNQPVQDVSF